MLWRKGEQGQEVRKAKRSGPGISGAPMSRVRGDEKEPTKGTEEEQPGRDQRAWGAQEKETGAGKK